MNILLLHCHDAGNFIQPYGYPVETPNLMQFAREGVLFRQAYAVSPTCGPSRSSMMTGQYPHQIGVLGLPGNQGWEIDDPKKHIVQTLRESGYETILGGVQHEADHSDFSSLGYERILEMEAPVRDQAGEFYPETIDKVERYLATRDNSRPFFLSVGIDEPHRDNIPREELNLHGASDRFSKTRYYDPEKLVSQYTMPPSWLPDIPEIRSDMESFYEGVRLMDEYMGRVLYALKHNKLDEKTLVIVTTDHGIEFPGAKKTLRDAGTHVMLMLRGPAGGPLSGGKVIDALCSHLDIYPTICEIVGQQAEHKLEGTSLLPLAAQTVSSLHDCIFSEQTYHGQLEPMRAVRTDRYKYIRYKDDVGPKMRHDGPTTTTMEPFGWYDRGQGEEALFDLYLDPMEVCNRAEDGAYVEIKESMSLRLDEWMQRTEDPFHNDKIPDPPKGW